MFEGVADISVESTSSNCECGLHFLENHNSAGVADISTECTRLWTANVIGSGSARGCDEPGQTVDQLCMAHVEVPGESEVTDHYMIRCETEGCLLPELLPHGASARRPLDSGEHKTEAASVRS